MKHILFVCTGNTCRSPLAEYLLRHKAGGSLEVKSAGVAAYSGGPIATHVQQLLAEKGIETDHASQNLTSELVEWADLILTMTEAHEQQLRIHFPEKAAAIYTIKRFVEPEAHDLNVSDPYGGSLDTYRETMAEIDILLDTVIEKEGKK
jgi:protein-tyrosine-phosphatase